MNSVEMLTFRRVNSSAAAEQTTIQLPSPMNYMDTYAFILIDKFLLDFVGTFFIDSKKFISKI
jgi:hypothetical protein